MERINEMIEYILILVIAFYQGGTSQSIVFPSKDACENAMKLALTELDTRWVSSTSYRAICVPKGPGAEDKR